jgi:hypothetical protein
MWLQWLEYSLQNASLAASTHSLVWESGRLVSESGCGLVSSRWVAPALSRHSGWLWACLVSAGGFGLVSSGWVAVALSPLGGWLRPGLSVRPSVRLVRPIRFMSVR